MHNNTMANSNYSDMILYEKASDHSYYNYDEVMNSQYAGCYHCKKYFSVTFINEEQHCIATTPHGTQEPTVFCPLCGIDAVIGDASGYPVSTTEFLKYMNDNAFTSK